jgi:hypothetical protein
MSLQVGASCYASAADAGRAACSQFSPMLHVGETTARTISCTSADATSGALNLKIVSTDLASSAVTVTAVCHSGLRGLARSGSGCRACGVVDLVLRYEACRLSRLVAW